MDTFSTILNAFFHWLKVFLQPITIVKSHKRRKRANLWVSVIIVNMIHRQNQINDWEWGSYSGITEIVRDRRRPESQESIGGYCKFS